mmetsp:Transcript_57621/g.137008  ORF Transcript_57621/g.137008 Transcript_57621/m.137008 type:complete len:412 (-) Transcript_57621:389-1624(-)
MTMDSCKAAEEMYYNQGRREEALAMCQRIRQNDPQNEEAKLMELEFRLVLSPSPGVFEELRDLAKRLDLSQHPFDEATVHTAFRMGSVFLEVEMYDEAQAKFTQVIGSHVDDDNLKALAYRGRGMAYHKQFKYAKAVEDYEVYFGYPTASDDDAALGYLQEVKSKLRQGSGSCGFASGLHRLCPKLFRRRIPGKSAHKTHLVTESVSPHVSPQRNYGPVYGSQTQKEAPEPAATAGEDAAPQPLTQSGPERSDKFSVQNVDGKETEQELRNSVKCLRELVKYGQEEVARQSARETATRPDGAFRRSAFRSLSGEAIIYLIKCTKDENGFFATLDNLATVRQHIDSGNLRAARLSVEENGKQLQETFDVGILQLLDADAMIDLIRSTGDDSKFLLEVEKKAKKGADTSATRL